LRTSTENGITKIVFFFKLKQDSYVFLTSIRQMMQLYGQKVKRRKNFGKINVLGIERTFIIQSRGPRIITLKLIDKKKKKKTSFLRVHLESKIFLKSSR
jgi:hypothetical protein